MGSLYTKDGVPLSVTGKRVFAPDGQEIGRIRGDKVFGPDARYVGTITSSNRLVYRSTQSTARGSIFSPSRRAGTARARAAGSAVWGEEPKID